MKEDVIEFFEGKLLTSYEHNNNVYIEKFCTCTDNREKFLYLVTKTTKDEISKFRNKEITLNNLFHNYSDDFDFYISQEESGLIVDFYRIKGSEIPSTYKAKDDVYYEESLSI